MSFEIGATLGSLVHAAGAPTGGPVQVGYGVSLTDLSGFNGALERVGARLEAQPAVSAPGAAAQQLMRPFEHINDEAVRLAADAKASQGAGAMNPSEMIQLTVRCQEFMFHCQLTSNIANKTSDGLQQLFRQQS